MNYFKNYTIGLFLLFMPIVAFSASSSCPARYNVTYTQAQIDSIVFVEVQRQVDTHLIDLKIDKTANAILEKYINEQSIIQARHDYFMGSLITILVAIVGILIPLKMDRDRERKIKRLEKELNKMVSIAKDSEFSIVLTRALSNEDVDVKIYALSQIIKKFKDNSLVALAYNNRGCEYDKKEDYDKAIFDYTKAIKIKPDFVEAYNNRGNSYYDKGEYDRAMKDYSKAIELNPDYAIAYCNRSRLFIDKEMYKDAESDLKKAIKLSPYSDKAYGQYANILHLQNNNNEALRKVNMAIKLNEEECLWYYLRSIILLNLKQYHRALKDAKKGLRIANRKGTEDVLTLLEAYLEHIESLVNNPNEGSPDNTDAKGDKKNSNNKGEIFAVNNVTNFGEDGLKNLLDLLRKNYKDNGRKSSNDDNEKEDKSIDEDDTE